MLSIIHHWVWIWVSAICSFPSTEISPATEPPLIDGKATSFAALPSPRMDTVTLDDYPFLHTEADTLINAGRLAPFFRKLSQLERGERRRINIVHIGDSHIQADWLTGYVRTRLQERFGSAGRGLVFPYTLAETNSPTDIRSGSNQSWEYRRSTFQQKHIPIGIAGMSIQTSGRQVWLDLLIRNDTLVNYAFDQVKLFGTSGPDALSWSIGQFKPGASVAVAPPPKVYHTVRSGDTLYDLARRYGTRVSRLQQWNRLRGSMIRPGQKLVVGNGRSTAGNYDPQLFQSQHLLEWERGVPQAQQAMVQLDSLTHRLLLRGYRTDGKTGQSRLYGMSLENSRQQGMLYHAIGVNGVTFYHYNVAGEFWQQLPDLEPDLIIVSLGTNEAAHSSFQASGFAEQVQAFAAHLEALPTATPVLFTTPPDALKRRRYNNPSIQIARSIITETAAAQDFALWDLFNVMGGAGAIKQWRAKQLAGRDFLHFNRTGYSLQGELLFRAIIQAYEAS